MHEGHAHLPARLMALEDRQLQDLLLRVTDCTARFCPHRHPQMLRHDLMRHKTDDIGRDPRHRQRQLRQPDRSQMHRRLQRRSIDSRQFQPHPPILGGQPAVLEHHRRLPVFEVIEHRQVRPIPRRDHTQLPQPEIPGRIHRRHIDCPGCRHPGSYCLPHDIVDMPRAQQIRRMTVIRHEQAERCRAVIHERQQCLQIVRG